MLRDWWGAEAGGQPAASAEVRGSRGSTGVQGRSRASGGRPHLSLAAGAARRPGREEQLQIKSCE